MICVFLPDDVSRGRAGLRSSWLAAVLLVATLPGCTRLNPEFGNEDKLDSANGGSDSVVPSSGSDRSTTLGPGDSSEGISTTEGPPGTDAGPQCPVVLAAICDRVGEACGEGQCRPYGTVGAPENVACVERGEAFLAPGAPCSHTCGAPLRAGLDDCAANYLCDPFEAANPSCVQLCGPAAKGSSCAPGMSCIKYETQGPPFALCQASCDPTTQDCLPGLNCFLTQDGFECVPAPAGVLDVGDTCENINSCLPGLICTTGGSCEGTGCCTRLCVTADDCEGPSPSCAPNESTPGFGLCQP